MKNHTVFSENYDIEVKKIKKDSIVKSDRGVSLRYEENVRRTKRELYRIGKYFIFINILINLLLGSDVL